MPVLLAALAGCAGGTAPLPVASEAAATPAPDGARGKAFLLTHGWHTDIAVPVDEISGPLKAFVARFPGARVMVFGYGRRDYMIERDHDLGEMMAGAIPGAGALEVSALRTDPVTAYGADHTMAVDLPPGGAERLSAFLWATFTRDGAGEPVEAGPGGFPGSVVYASAQGYALSHTCNTWSAEALAASGLPVRPAGIIFSSQVDAEVQPLAVRPAAVAGGG
jgi:hypothetical protein